MLVLRHGVHRVPAPSPLGHVHRHICAAEQRLRIRRVLRIERNPHAPADRERRLFYFERPLQALEQLTSDDLRSGRARRRQQHREFVTAKSCQCVGVAHLRKQSRSDLAQQSIAPFVPERIVDILEAVQVQHQERQRSRTVASRAECLLESVREQRAVWQSCQCVV